jgi:antitoxin HicB
MTMRSKDNVMTRTLSDYLTLPYRLEITPSEYGGYVVRYPELLGCVTQVETIEDAVPMAREILEGWIEIALEDGAEVPIPRPPESYSGKFIVRMSKSLHRRLSERAEEEGVSLNHYAVSLLERGDASHRVSRRLDDMAYQLASIHERLQYDFVDMPNQMRMPELQLVVNNTVAA